MCAYNVRSLPFSLSRESTELLLLRFQPVARATRVTGVLFLFLPTYIHLILLSTPPPSFVHSSLTRYPRFVIFLKWITHKFRSRAQLTFYRMCGVVAVDNLGSTTRSTRTCSTPCGLSLSLSWAWDSVTSCQTPIADVASLSLRAWWWVCYRPNLFSLFFFDSWDMIILENWFFFFKLVEMRND